jgi:hypothetical protein
MPLWCGVPVAPDAGSTAHREVGALEGAKRDGSKFGGTCLRPTGSAERHGRRGAAGAGLHGRLLRHGCNLKEPLPCSAAVEGSRVGRPTGLALQEGAAGRPRAAVGTRILLEPPRTRAARQDEQTPAASAPGLGSPLLHLRRDWAHCCHICTGLCTPAASCLICTGTGLPPCRICTWTAQPSHFLRFFRCARRSSYSA